MSAKSQVQRAQDAELPLPKLLRFMGWVFFGLILCVVAYMGLQSLTPGVGFISTLSFETLMMLFIFAAGSGLSFGIAAEIQEYPEKKKELFKSFIIALILISFIEILVCAAYQW